MELGKKIRQLRFKASLTQEQLAEKLGIGPQSVSKWENAVAMPDITTLPLLAEVFGVSIDDLFDLTTEQRLNRIENRMDLEEDLPQDVFMEYEDFLKAQLADGQNKKRATELLAYLYWHRMDTYARKTSRYAKEAVRLSPRRRAASGCCRWQAGHASWDWNLRNHSAAIDFYRELDRSGPRQRARARLPDGQSAGGSPGGRGGGGPREAAAARRTSARSRTRSIGRISPSRDSSEPAADRIMETLRRAPEGSASHFEAAQYYAAKKCDYDKAIAAYEARLRAGAAPPALHR